MQEVWLQDILRTLPWFEEQCYKFERRKLLRMKQFQVPSQRSGGEYNTLSLAFLAEFGELDT